MTFSLKKILFVFMLLFFTKITYTQIYYSNDSHAGVGELSLETCEFKKLGFLERFADIALHPNGKFYSLAAVDTDEGLRCALVELDVFNQIHTDTLCILPDICTALTASKEGVFYFGFDGIHSFNPETEELITHGGLPNGMALGGDFVFFKGDLLGCAYNPGNPEGTAEIYKVNIENPQNSELIFDFLIPGIIDFALTMQNSSCDMPLLLASYNKRGASLNTSYIVNVDLANGTYDTICHRVSRRLISGLASADEHRTNCELRIDLDEDNNSGRFIDHFETDLRCSTHYPIADNDVVLRTSELYIDSMVVNVHRGLESEILLSEVVEGFSITGLNTKKLVFYNTGMATTPDFITAVQTVRFVIQDEAPEGEREVRVQLYANGVPSDAAKAFIQVNHEVTSAGNDAEVELCLGGGDPKLFQSLGEEARAGGIWSPTLHSGTDFFSLSQDDLGVYQYMISEGSCTDTATVVVSHRPEPEIDLMTNQNGAVYLCAGDSIVWDVTIANPRYYVWSTGASGPVQTITQAGEYAVEVRDTVGCFTYVEAVVLVLADSSITVREEISLCGDESWEWQGQVITTDTIICEVFPRFNGCDSTYCRIVTFETVQEHTEYVALCGETTYIWQGLLLEQDTFLCITYSNNLGCDSTECLDLRFSPDYHSIESHVFICGRDSYTVEGVSFTQDTTFCLSYGSENGCDSVRCIEVSLLDPLAIEEEISICEGAFYFWPVTEQIYTETGQHTAVVTGVNDCDSTFILDLKVFPRYQIYIDTTILMGDSLFIGQQFFTESGTYVISLESQTHCDSIINLSLDVITSLTNITPLISDYYVPSFIQPMSNQWNNYFTVYHLHQQKANIQSLEVFDIWGRPVYKASNIPIGMPEKGWNGRQNGVVSPSGIYFYRIIMEDENYQIKSLSGSLIIGS